MKTRLLANKELKRYLFIIKAQLVHYSDKVSGKNFGRKLNKKMSKEYIASLAIVLVGVLKLFKVEIGTEVISALIIAVLGLYSAVKRYQRGDITIGGIRK